MKARVPDFVTIGRIVKAHGIKGAVKVKPVTDYPPRFKKLKTVFLEFPGGEMGKQEISAVLVRENIIYLQFKEIESREKANALRGALINIKGEDVLPLPENEFYHFEVIGFVVKTDAGQIIGEVHEVLDMPANAVLVVRDAAHEHLIPVIREVIERIDKLSGEIIIKPMEGLLEL